MSVLRKILGGLRENLGGLRNNIMFCSRNRINCLLIIKPHFQIEKHPGANGANCKVESLKVASKTHSHYHTSHVKGHTAPLTLCSSHVVSSLDLFSSSHFLASFPSHFLSHPLLAFDSFFLNLFNFCCSLPSKFAPFMFFTCFLFFSHPLLFSLSLLTFFQLVLNFYSYTWLWQIDKLGDDKSGDIFEIRSVLVPFKHVFSKTHIFSLLFLIFSFVLDVNRNFEKKTRRT